MVPIPPEKSGSAYRSIESGPFCVSEISYAPGSRQAAHEHDYATITLVFAGGIRETVRADDVVGTSLSVVVKPAGVRHADLVGPDGAATVQVAIRNDWLAERGRDGVDLGEWRWLGAPRVSREFLQLLAELRGDATDPSLLHDLALDIIGGLTDSPNERGRSIPSWMQRARECLEDTAHATSVTALAREAGVHPVSLTRAFRRYLGASVTEYRRRVRLRRAAGEIVAANRPLSNIAHDVGYADHAHLCREFGRATGLTPTAFRRLAQRVPGG